MLKNDELILKASTCIVQTPGSQDMERIALMKTGGLEDKTQQDRLNKISKHLPNNATTTHIRTDSKQIIVSEKWLDLFNTFSPPKKMSTRHGGGESKKEQALHAFNNIPDDDPIKKVLLTVHTRKYVVSIIEACIDAQDGKMVIGFDNSINTYLPLDEDEDVIVQPHTFEVLIRDFVTTITTYNQQKNTASYLPLFSVGLPTHHASQNEASGFCIFNKVAMLIEYFKQQNVMVLGLDINADNGLQNCLEGLVKNNKDNPQVIIHYDIYDSQVWPNKKFNPSKSKNQSSSYSYIPINLKDAKRGKNQIHPVMQRLINELEKQAKENGADLAIYIPLGWDSHENETASCGRVPFEKQAQGEKYRKEKRFSDTDFFWFYQKLAEIKQKYKINFLYIGLEGGYTQEVYQLHSQILVEIISGVKTLNENLTLTDKSQSNKKLKEEKEEVVPEKKTKRKKRTNDSEQSETTEKTQQVTAHNSTKQVNSSYSLRFMGNRPKKLSILESSQSTTKEKQATQHKKQKTSKG